MNLFIFLIIRFIFILMSESKFTGIGRIQTICYRLIRNIIIGERLVR